MCPETEPAAIAPHREDKAAERTAKNNRDRPQTEKERSQEQHQQHDGDEPEMGQQRSDTVGTVLPSAAARPASVGKPPEEFSAGPRRPGRSLMSLISWPWSKPGLVATSRRATGPRGRSRRRAAASVAAGVSVLSSICLWMVDRGAEDLLVTGRTTASSVAVGSLVKKVACTTWRSPCEKATNFIGD